jgi:cyclohexadienyl dehydratase
MARYTLLISLIFWNSLVAANDGNLYRLIQQRLALMKDVAAHKWIHGLPIENTKREAIVINAATLRGLQHGVKVAATAALFSAQISAAKEIQQHWFSTWRVNSAPKDAPDLEARLRPDLIKLGADIVSAMSQRSSLGATDWLTLLQTEGLSQDSIIKLDKAVRAIAFYEHRLDQILDAKILRVGTTGDYRPFSFVADKRAEFRGIDIDLARNLAASLGVELELVNTSWPSLTHDLGAGKFDIAMSGVSLNSARRQIGYFSVPYHRGGKTPISQCLEKEKFSSLELIDSAETRIVVNPGGTNQRFVENNIRHAQVIVHNDNRSIFHQIVNGNTDVMITDRIEVQLQTQLHPTLCSTMPQNNFTIQDKAYLMPKDVQLKHAVDEWLSTRLEDGTVAGLFSDHLQQRAE